MKDIDPKEIQLSIDEKKDQNVQKSLVTIKEMPVTSIMFFKMKPKIFLDKL